MRSGMGLNGGVSARVIEKGSFGMYYRPLIGPWSKFLTLNKRKIFHIVFTYAKFLYFCSRET